MEGISYWDASDKNRRNSLCVSSLAPDYSRYPYPHVTTARNKMDISFLLNHDHDQFQRIGDFGVCHRTPRQKPKKEKIYPCSVCTMSFSTRNSRKKHVLSVHEKRRPFPCSFPGCTSAFAERGNMLKHLRAVHHKQKNAKCDLCNAEFAFNDGLLRHKRMTHGNERPYICLKCNFGFKQKSHLRVHAMRCQNRERASPEKKAKKVAAAATRISRHVSKHY